MSNHNSHQDIMDAIYSRFGQDLVDSDGKPMEWVFEVREGNGNMGEHHRCDIYATSASEALVKAHRHGFISSPWDVRITKDIECDGITAAVASYVRPIFGDVCRWTASASLAIDSRNQK